MGRKLEIKNVPDDLLRMMSARASIAGLSLSEYVIEEMRKVMARPTNDEILARLAKLPPVVPNLSSAEEIRQTREERMRELDLRDEERSRRRS
jgi:hypothetical protein